jgi:hypothetical protein
MELRRRGLFYRIEFGMRISKFQRDSFRCPDDFTHHTLHNLLEGLVDKLKHDLLKTKQAPMGTRVRSVTADDIEIQMPFNLVIQKYDLAKQLQTVGS